MPSRARIALPKRRWRVSPIDIVAEGLPTARGTGMPMREPVDDNARARVNRELDRVEREADVRVLFACESGSRAWGFESTDSDYDVRFIYLRRPQWYLSIDIATRRDVIEEPIDDSLDVSGWDIVKALNLFRHSNPPLFEWLGSPIIYRDVHALASDLRGLSDGYYLPKAAAYHYVRMAQNNWRSYLQRPLVRTKKYVYALRPLLAALWLERQLGVVPTPFATLVETVVDDAAVRDAANDLVARKLAGKERDESPPIPVLHDYLAHHLERLDDVAAQIAPEPRGDPDVLSAVMRRCLHEAWA